MKTTGRDLTSGSLWGQIMLFSLPLIASNILQVLFNMSDVAVVGQFSGSKALGEVGSTSILVTLFVGFLIGIGSGINTRVARHIGERDETAVSKTVHTSALISLIIGVILAVIGFVFARNLLELLNTKEELIDGAVLYLRIYFLSMPAVAIYNFGNAVFSADGDTKRPLIILLGAGIVNVLLNLFFVIVCDMSVAGVALASVISQYMSAFLILLFLFRSKSSYGLRLKLLRIDTQMAKAVISIGVPAGLQNSIFAIANLFIQSGVNSFDAVMVEGNSAAINADALVYDVMAAFYIACSSYMSQNFGARKKDRVLKSYVVSLVYSFGAGAVLGGGLVLFGEQFLSIFTPDASVTAAGMIRLKIMGLSYAVSAFMDCTIAASRGLGKSLVPTIIVIMGSCVFRVAWVYTVFAYFGTIKSLYLLYIFSWTITSVAEMIYFARCYKKQTAGLDETLTDKKKNDCAVGAGL